MSVEFRQRSVSEYLNMLWRHKLVILLPALAIGIAVSYVVAKLPSVYESKSSLAINPPAISNRAVQSLTDDDVTQRLNAITQEVMSRTSLEPLITRFNLFERERATGTPMELLIEQMRRSTTTETVKADNDKGGVITVAYKDRDPNKARDVTAELASKYIKKQQETLIANSGATREFFDKQLGEVKGKLDEIDRQRLNYMLSNADKLPSGATGLIAQLESVGSDIKLARDKENSINSEIGRTRDQIAFNVREQNNLRQFADKEEQQNRLLLANVNRNPIYVERKKRKSELDAQLANLKTQYREAHPDVIAKKTEVEQVAKELIELEQQAKSSADEAKKTAQGSAELRIQNLDNERQRLESEIARQQRIIEEVRVYAEKRQAEIAGIQARLSSIPTAEVQLGSFERDYATAKQNYDELLKKKNDAELQYERDQNLQGATIEIVDPARTPQAPMNASKRYSFMFLGFGAGFGLGLLFALLLEFQRFLTINTVEDAKHYTHLPVLAAVPELVTESEQSWQRKLGVFKVMGGFAATILSVPLLIIALQTTNIFERFIS